MYCTARIDGATNPSGHADQDVYLKALLATGSVDHIEYGTYVARVKTAPLAVKDPQGRPRLVAPAWPVMVQGGRGGPVAGAVFMVPYANREEKGSDVNVARTCCWMCSAVPWTARWLFPTTATCGSRASRPVSTFQSAWSTRRATICPGDLRGSPTAGAGRHWWARLIASDLKTHQLPDPAGRYRRPAGW